MKVYFQSRYRRSVKKEKSCVEKSLNVSLAKVCSKEICYDNGSFTKAGSK